MNRRYICALLCILAMLLSSSMLLAQEQVDENSIPIYTGGSAMLDIRMTDRLIVPAITSLTKTANSYAEKLEKKQGQSTSTARKTSVDPVIMKAAVEDLTKLFSGLKEVHMALYALPEKTQPSCIVGFYTAQLKLDDGWDKLAESADENLSALVMERKSKDGLLCLGIYDDKALVLRTSGTFNSAQLSEWMGRYGDQLVGLFMSSVSPEKPAKPTVPAKPTDTKPKGK